MDRLSENLIGASMRTRLEDKYRLAGGEAAQPPPKVPKRKSVSSRGSARNLTAGKKVQGSSQSGKLSKSDSSDKFTPDPPTKKQKVDAEVSLPLHGPGSKSLAGLKDKLLEENAGAAEASEGQLAGPGEETVVAEVEAGDFQSC